jgi:sulfonate dioxygenase
VTTHSATFDFFPEKRHALRATPQAEKPLSVQEYEKRGKIAKDRQKEIWKSLGYDPDKQAGEGAKASNDLGKAKVYND